MARFPQESEEEWIREAWSVVVEPTDDLGAHDVEQVLVSFLSDEAPLDRLAPGAHFALMEGKATIAEVEIIGHIQDAAEGPDHTIA